MRYVLTKPKSTDLNRIQGVFSSRSGIRYLLISFNHILTMKTDAV